MEDLWRETRRELHRLTRPLPARRYLAPTVVTLLALSASVWTWTRAVDVVEREFKESLEQLTDQGAMTIESSLSREVEAVRNLSISWQLYGVNPDEEAWKFRTGMLLSYFPGIRWIRWQPNDGTAGRVVSQPDTIVPEQLEGVDPSTDAAPKLISEHWDGDYHVRAAFPVRNDTGSGTLFAEIIVDSSWMANQSMAPAHQIVMELRPMEEPNSGSALRGTPPPGSPPGATRLMRGPAGSALRLSVWPTETFAKREMSPWPHLFLATGVILALSLGLVMYQFLRIRDYTQVLVETNRDLDAQVEGLSRRDAELQKLTAELEVRVDKRTSELTDALRRLETFSHSVSHDLRSPIGAIINFAGVLDEDYGETLGSEGRRIVGRIVAAGERAGRLLTGLVEFAGSGATVEERRSLDVRSIAERAFAEVIAQDPDPQTVRFALERVPAAYGDPSQTQRIFVNLLSNALKYSRTREVREIQIGSEEGTPHNTYYVRDNGPGFDPERAKEIFEPLRRLHGAETEGAGLGLAIVARLVEQYGGRAWATSDGLTGATFFFTLPRSGADRS